ncbi:MAG TPA: DUF5522 domain-containing protein [Patescibacteria group bacterium]|nr:DUF5522 domain-containing protein [Patescibacteria group bacterium]
MLRQTLIEGEDYYLDEHGFVVLTEAFHKKRGYCCGSGCKHCPYEHEAVKKKKK